MALHLRDKKSGYVSMLTIAILMIVVTTITITVITVLIDNTHSYKIITESNKARANADACIEIAINKLKESSSYTGNESITTQHGSCQIGVISGAGNSNRIIPSTGLYNNIIRRVEVMVSTLNPNTIIISWREVDVF